MRVNDVVGSICSSLIAGEIPTRDDFCYAAGGMGLHTV
jgi:hypothetical protein